METIEVLRQAADVVRQRGWTQWTNEGTDGAVCLDGALHVALFDDPTGEATRGECSPALRALAESLRGRGGPWNTNIPAAAVMWQDSEDRTQDEVLELIDTTIARLGGT